MQKYSSKKYRNEGKGLMWIALTAQRDLMHLQEIRGEAVQIHIYRCEDKT